MPHVETVQRIYQAFGQGDVGAILERLADDVEWEYGVTSTDVQWLQPRQGRADVVHFFQALGALDIHKFEPTAFIDGGDVVVALVNFEATVRATGRRIVEEDEVHLWRFDGSGRISRFRHRADTHQHWMAVAGK